MLGLDINNREYLKDGVILGLGYYLLGWVLTYFNFQLINITLSTVEPINVNVRQQLLSNFQGVATGVNTQFFPSLLASLTGIVPAGAMGVVYSIIGGILVIYLGGITLQLLNQANIGERLSETWKLTVILILGSVGWGVILGSLVLPTAATWTTLISPVLALVISSAIVALIATYTVVKANIIQPSAL